jgi:hypothetical protein
VKLTVFHAQDGDCLLLSSGDDPPRHVLVDGGRKTSYEKFTRPFLGALREAQQPLDVVCVSHIDDDHISGILRLVEDEVAWRVHEFRRSLDPSAKPPKTPRPPEIREVWHNGLFRLVGDDATPVVEEVLETVATLLAGSPDAAARDLASRLGDLATGEASSMELSRRLSAEQLGIALNPRADGGIVRRGDAAPADGEAVSLGSLRVSVLGPSDDDVERLRVEWRTWLEANRQAIRDLQEKLLADEERLGTVAPPLVANPLLDAALGAGLGGVTEANLASIMLLVEEGPVSVLLPGDGVSSEILEGLAHHGKLDAEGRIHVNVLKVQHHGALANVTEEFVRRVTADHYVFCGNGAHENPEEEVVRAFAAARLQGVGGSPPVGPAGDFTFWFTSNAATDNTASRRAHMRRVEDAVAELRQGHSRMKAKFLAKGRFEVPLP